MNPSEYTASIDLQGLRAVVDQAKKSGGNVQVVIGLNAPGIYATLTPTIIKIMPIANPIRS